MVCEHCGTIFCWDEADVGSLGGSRKLYCSRSCKSKATVARAGTVKALQLIAEQQVRRKKRQLELCKVQGKKQYADVVLARTTAQRLYIAKGWMLYPYECACGFWHLTREKPEGVDDGEFFRSYESPAFRDWEARAAGRR